MSGSKLREPRAHEVRANGVRLCCFEYGERSVSAPTALFAHATGFHARCFDRTIAATGLHAFSIDMRGHGRSDKTPPYEWSTFGADVIGVVDALGLDDLIGVGHSMGGHAIVQAAAARSQRFRRLVLIDPVIMSPDAYAAGPAAGPFAGISDASAHPVARRRNQFASAAEMQARFGEREPFSKWRPEVLADYCTYGLLPAPDGGLVLACPPIVEASIYLGSAGRDLHHLLATVTMPVTVLRARERVGARAGAMDFSNSPTWPGLAAAFAQGRDVYLPERSHFIPMEAPEQVADYVAGR